MPEETIDKWANHPTREEPIIELSLQVGRHAEVTGFYHPAQRAFVNVDQIHDRGQHLRVLTIADERNGRLYVNKDLKCGPVYDRCGYLSVRSGDCSWETLNEFAAKLGLSTTFTNPAYLYTFERRRPLAKCLTTNAGSFFPLTSERSVGDYVAHLRRTFDAKIDVDVAGAQALVICAWDPI